VRTHDGLMDQGFVRFETQVRIHDRLTDRPSLRFEIVLTVTDSATSKGSVHSQLISLQFLSANDSALQLKISNSKTMQYLGSTLGFNRLLSSRVQYLVIQQFSLPSSNFTGPHGIKSQKIQSESLERRPKSVITTSTLIY
jgi:hypothetical protein